MTSILEMLFVVGLLPYRITFEILSLLTRLGMYNKSRKFVGEKFLLPLLP
jgi:hypothetical protein